MSNRLRVTIVAFTIFSTTFANNALSPIYVIYEQQFGFSSLSLTSIFATYAIAVLAALLCTGRLSDDIGRKPVLLAGSALMVASTAIFLGAWGTAALFVARALLGLATGMIVAAGSGALVELEPNHDPQRASLLTTLAFLAGAALGPLLFGVVAQYLPDPLRTPFLIELGLQLVGLVSLFTIAEPASHELRPLRWRIQQPAVPREIRRPFAIAGAVVTTGWMIGGIYGSLSGSLDRQLLHLHSHALAGLVLFVFAFIAGSSQLLLRNVSARAVMATGVGTAAIGIALLEASLVEVSAPLFVAATIVAGIGNGLAFVGSLALVNEVTPRSRRVEVISAYNVVAYFALSLPIVGVGLIANVFGLKSATLVFTIVLVTLALCTLAALSRASLTAVTAGEELALIDRAS